MASLAVGDAITQPSLSKALRVLYYTHYLAKLCVRIRNVISLDAYALKMSSVIKIGSLGAQNDNFKVPPDFV